MLQKPNKVRATQQSLHYTVFLPRWCRLSLEARESVNLLLPWLSVQLNRFPSVNVIPIYNSDYIGPIDWKAPFFCYFRGNYSVYQCCTLKLPIFVLNQSIFGWDMTKMLNRHFSILCLNVDAQINLEMANIQTVLDKMRILVISQPNIDGFCSNLVHLEGLMQEFD